MSICYLNSFHYLSVISLSAITVIYSSSHLPPGLFFVLEFIFIFWLTTTSNFSAIINSSLGFQDAGLQAKLVIKEIVVLKLMMEAIYLGCCIQVQSYL